MQPSNTTLDLLQSGFEHQKHGRMLEAETAYRTVLNETPDQPDALFLLGVLAARKGLFAPALDLVQRSVRLHPSLPKFLELGRIWQQVQQPGHALGCCDAALNLSPMNPDACALKGSILLNEGMFDESVQWLERARAAYPNNINILNDLGLAFAGQGKTDKALDLCKNLVKAAPDNFSFHANLAVAHLIRGEFREGFKEYQWRWDMPAFQSAYPWKLWRGEKLVGKTLLIHGEHGFGDAIQFCRYAPLASKRGARVVLRVPRPLVRLMSSLAGVDKVVSSEDPLPAIDFHCSMMDIIPAFGTEPSTIPADIPYLKASPSDLSRWAQLIPANKDKRKIGLVWAGAPNRENPQLSAKDRRRSMPPDAFGPLLDLKDFDFFSLQKSGSPFAHPSLIDFMTDCHDFADTAALIMQLDLVISVDTSVAHLAGALGKPVWLLNKYDSCWRWFCNREDTPWYPLMRIFRQKSSRNWHEVIERVKNALKSLT